MPEGSTTVRMRVDAEDYDRFILPVQNWRDPERWTSTLDRIPIRLDKYIPSNPTLEITGIDYSIGANTRGEETGGEGITVAVGETHQSVHDALTAQFAGGSTTGNHRLDSKLLLMRSLYHASEEPSVVGETDGIKFSTPYSWEPEDYLYFGLRTPLGGHQGAAAKVHVYWNRV